MYGRVFQSWRYVIQQRYVCVALLVFYLCKCAYTLACTCDFFCMPSWFSTHAMHYMQTCCHLWYLNIFLTSTLQCHSFLYFAASYLVHLQLQMAASQKQMAFVDKELLGMLRSIQTQVIIATSYLFNIAYVENQIECRLGRIGGSKGNLICPSTLDSAELVTGRASNSKLRKTLIKYGLLLSLTTQMIPAVIVTVYST